MTIPSSSFTFRILKCPGRWAIIRFSSRAEPRYKSRKAPRGHMEKSLSYTVGEFLFPGVNGEEGRLGFILLNFIFSQFRSKCPKAFWYRCL